MTQKQKTKFRSSSKWKKFRNYIKKLYNSTDPITNKPLYKGWNLHHLNEKQYDDLDENKFIPLNKATHSVIHWLERYDDYEGVAERLVNYVREMKKFNSTN